MKHKLTIGVSKKSPKDEVVTYKKVYPEAKVKNLIGGAGKVAIIVPGNSVKSVNIEESKEDGYGKQRGKAAQRHFRRLPWFT